MDKFFTFNIFSARSVFSLSTVWRVRSQGTPTVGRGHGSHDTGHRGEPKTATEGRPNRHLRVLGLTPFESLICEYAYSHRMKFPACKHRMD